jgi:hypothetical protein
MGASDSWPSHLCFRQLWDMKGTVQIEELTPSGLIRYAEPALAEAVRSRRPDTGTETRWSGQRA